MSARSGTTYTLFVSSPGDVMDERKRAVGTIERLNGEFRDQLRLRVIAYEHQVFSADRGPQEQISLASETDLVIGILWSRTGTALDPVKYLRADGSPYEERHSI